MDESKWELYVYWLRRIEVEKHVCESILIEKSSHAPFVVSPLIKEYMYFWLCGSEISFLCGYQPTIMDGNFHVISIY